MTSSSHSTTLRLAEVLDLTAAAPLAADLMARRGRRLVLDAGGVQRLGGLCLQVLLSARADWEAADVPLSIANPSPTFTAALAQLGVDPFPPSLEDAPS